MEHHVWLCRAVKTPAVEVTVSCRGEMLRRFAALAVAQRGALDAGIQVPTWVEARLGVLRGDHGSLSAAEVDQSAFAGMTS